MNRFLIFAFTIILYGCSQHRDLAGFDKIAWQEDSGGCQLMRIKLIDDLIPHFENIKGLNQDEVIKLLGKPDENELYKRNQKFFIYNISPHNCENEDSKVPRKYLSIRFNATGLAKEVIIYTE